MDAAGSSTRCLAQSNSDSTMASTTSAEHHKDTCINPPFLWFVYWHHELTGSSNGTTSREDHDAMCRGPNWRRLDPDRHDRVGFQPALCSLDRFCLLRSSPTCMKVAAITSRTSSSVYVDVSRSDITIANREQIDWGAGSTTFVSHRSPMPLASSRPACSTRGANGAPQS